MNTVEALLQELSHFEGREEGLRHIMRYHIYKTLYYRFSDFSHDKRVAWLLQSITPLLKEILGGSIDTEKALVMALVHDDDELVIGDYQAGEKSKMSLEQLAAIKEEEKAAMAQLVEKFPKQVGGYEYGVLLQEVADISTPEAQVVKYLDRFDAMGEALHELYAGNGCMNTNVTTSFGLITLPFQSYYEMLPKMIEKYPTLQILKESHVFFELPEQRDWHKVVAAGKPHTRESLFELTGHPQYDAWKRVVLDRGDSEEIKNLYTQREFIV
jgi:5'-deoxynucleotidase YfbR-like HD superfamily hydrolase